MALPAPFTQPIAAHKRPVYLMFNKSPAQGWSMHFTAPFLADLEKHNKVPVLLKNARPSHLFSKPSINVWFPRDLGLIIAPSARGTAG